MSEKLRALVARRKLLLGVVHLEPLPGSPRARGDLAGVAARAAADARALLEAGFDGYVLENFGDAPFFPEAVPPHVLTAMTRIACELPRESAFVACNVLRNDARGALAVALAAGLQAIRVNVHTGAMVTDQGLVEGRAAETLRLRRELGCDVAILADVAVKHAAPLGGPPDLEALARETAYRGLADALIVTGKATGSPVRLEDLRAVRAAVPDRPLLAGSGVSEATVEETLRVADGVIAGTALKEEGRVERPVDPERARRFAARARSVP